MTDQHKLDEQRDRYWAAAERAFRLRHERCLDDDILEYLQKPASTEDVKGCDQGCETDNTVIVSVPVDNTGDST